MSHCKKNNRGFGNRFVWASSCTAPGGAGKFSFHWRRRNGWHTGYYNFVKAGRQEVKGLPAAGAMHLAPLKARSWLDLTRRQSNGERIDSKAIKKHKNDILRLFQILDPTTAPAALDAVEKDLRDFIMRMRGEDVDLKALGFLGGMRNSVPAELTTMFRLG